MASEPLPTSEQMLGFVMRFIQAGKRAEGKDVVVLTEFADDYVVLHGFIQRVRRLAQAYLLLERKSFATEARILARAALEHAVTGQWVFYTVDGLDRMRVSTARDQYRLAVEVGLIDKGVLKELEEGVPSGKGMYNWKDIREELDDATHFLAQTYSVLSQIVHVTHSTVMDAISVDEGGEVTLRDMPEAQMEQEVLYALSGACILTWWLEVVMTNDVQRQQRLQENSVELRMPMRLDHNLSNSRRRSVGPPLD